LGLFTVAADDSEALRVHHLKIWQVGEEEDAVKAASVGIPTTGEILGAGQC